MTFYYQNILFSVSGLILALLPLYSLGQQTTSSIEEQAINYLYQQYTNKFPSAQINIKVTPIKQKTRLNNCSSNYQFSAIKRYSARPFFKVTCPEHPNKSLFVRATVTATQQALMSSVNITKGQQIQSANLSNTTVDALKYKNNIFRDPSEVKGLVAQRNIAAGRVLTRKLVVAAPTIVEGDAVMIEAVRAGVKIRTAGTADETGYIGKFIQVTNNRSGKTIRAEIISKGLVRSP